MSASNADNTTGGHHHQGLASPTPSPPSAPATAPAPAPFSTPPPPPPPPPSMPPPPPPPPPSTPPPPPPPPPPPEPLPYEVWRAQAIEWRDRSRAEHVHYRWIVAVLEWYVSLPDWDRNNRSPEREWALAYYGRFLRWWCFWP
ncbi:hypothetical protein BDU57DRAFT_535474 [Ampelomyces quisqualis]|uniref:Uncharacterized protein n=1 Tax=Ampelomyces quisqualis TaxID=50730 RepID=A0A6A5R1D4_AMPQU|nr:hypothetical protein BDU57DRAFT_535474 [Ampelomyces quisqualis]